MKTEMTEQQKAKRRIELEIRRRPEKFATKVRRHMKKEGLRSGELLLEYWKKPNHSLTSLKEINLQQDVIVMKIEQEISKYKEALRA